jgi:hypothetical protein
LAELMRLSRTGIVDWIREVAGNTEDVNLPVTVTAGARAANDTPQGAGIVREPLVSHGSQCEETVS